ncbi:MAG: hypothetical protein LC781_13520 [Actinobacteria bacterium]|nr:hypothetical protein [Actinomycetota bacterium]
MAGKSPEEWLDQVVLVEDEAEPGGGAVLYPWRASSWPCGLRERRTWPLLPANPTRWIPQAEEVGRRA